MGTLMKLSLQNILYIFYKIPRITLHYNFTYQNMTLHHKKSQVPLHLWCDTQRRQKTYI